MEGNLTFATRSIGLFWRENGSCSSRLKESQWVSEPLYDYFRRNRILDEGLRFLKRRSQCTMTATKPSKKCALVTQFFAASFLVSVVMVALSSLVAFPCNTTMSPEKPTIWLKTRDEIDVRRYATGADPGGGCRGCAPPPPDMTCGFLIQLVFCKKNYEVYWCWSRARDECTPSYKKSWIRPCARDTPVVEWKRPYSKKKRKCWIT